MINFAMGVLAGMALVKAFPESWVTRVAVRLRQCLRWLLDP